MTDKRLEFHSERSEKGLQIHCEGLGGKCADHSIAAADDASAPLQKLLTK